IVNGEVSGKFWTSDPREAAAAGRAKGKVIAASVAEKGRRIYRGITKTPEEAAERHYHSPDWREAKDVLGFYRWTGAEWVPVPIAPKTEAEEPEVPEIPKGKERFAKAGQAYVDRIKNPTEKKFAQEYFDALLSGAEDKPEGLGVSAVKVNRIMTDLSEAYLAHTKEEPAKEELPPVKVTEDIEEARAQTDINPTEEQKRTGNYRKGKLRIHMRQAAVALTFNMENPKGSIRSGVDEDGETWEHEMPWDYGHVSGYKGADKDELDFFLGPLWDQTDRIMQPPGRGIFVIDQIDEEGNFDEHKVMFGFENSQAAIDGYMDAYEDGWKGFGGYHSFSQVEFMDWLKSKMQAKPAVDYEKKAKQRERRLRKAARKKAPLFADLIEQDINVTASEQEAREEYYEKRKEERAKEYRKALQEDKEKEKTAPEEIAKIKKQILEETSGFTAAHLDELDSYLVEKEKSEGGPSILVRLGTWERVLERVKAGKKISDRDYGRDLVEGKVGEEVLVGHGPFLRSGRIDVAWIKAKIVSVKRVGGPISGERFFTVEYLEDPPDEKETIGKTTYDFWKDRRFWERQVRPIGSEYRGKFVPGQKVTDVNPPEDQSALFEDKKETVAEIVSGPHDVSSFNGKYVPGYVVKVGKKTAVAPESILKLAEGETEVYPPLSLDAMAKQVAEAFSDVTEQQAEFVIQFVRARANAIGMPVDEYVRRTIAKVDRDAEIPDDALFQVPLEKQPTDDQLRAWADEFSDKKDFYFESHRAIISKVAGNGTTVLQNGVEVDDAELLFNLLAVTSILKSPKDNLGAAFNALFRIKAGKKVKGVARSWGRSSLIDSTARIIDDEIAQGKLIPSWHPLTEEIISSARSQKKRVAVKPEDLRQYAEETNIRAKIISFYWNLKDPENEDFTTIDTWIMVLFYGKKYLNKNEYKDIADRIRKIASERGWKPHQVQSALWYAAQKAAADSIRQEARNAKTKKQFKSKMQKAANIEKNYNFAELIQLRRFSTLLKAAQLSGKYGKPGNIGERTLNQVAPDGTRGSITFVDDGRAIISAYGNAQFDTLIHELLHLFRRDLEIMGEWKREHGDRPDVTLAEWEALEKWAGAKDGEWTREAEEKFARGFERYLAEGKAPTSGLQPLFDKLRKWLIEVYLTLTGTPFPPGVTINKEVRAIFGKMLQMAPEEKVKEPKPMSLAELGGTEEFKRL
ncbi:MAG: hypothetical protein PVJ01_06290, partial [Pseudomonadota bacterium]